MENLINNLNSLSEVRAKITDSQTMAELANKIKLGVMHFNINDSVDDIALSELSGIYYIEAKLSFSTAKALDEFGGLWGKIRSKKQLPSWVSRYYVKRGKVHTKAIRNNEYIPFYLGKSENIKKRVVEHLSADVTSETYSLKLNLRPDIVRDIEFRISFYELNITSDAYFGIELVERELRKIFNPIIGKQ